MNPDTAAFVAAFRAALRAAGAAALFVFMALILCLFIVRDVRDMAATQTKPAALAEAAKTAGGETVLLPVKVGNKYGFIDGENRVVIPPRFDGACDFHEGYAPVRIGDKTAFVDTKGNLLHLPENCSIYDEGWGMFIWPSEFSEGLAVVECGGRRGYMDTKGNMVIKAAYKGAMRFKEGVAPVHSKGGWGYIDTRGRFVIPPRYLYADEFSDGRAVVSNSTAGRFLTNYFVIDKAGKRVGKRYYDHLQKFSDGLAVAQIIYQHTGYIDVDGNQAIPARFTDAGRFENGLAIVEEPERDSRKWKFGIINKAGEYVLPPKYHAIKSISGNLALVEDNNQAKLIDLKGNTVYVFDQTDTMEIFFEKNGYISIREKMDAHNTIGILDRNLNYIKTISAP